MSDLDRGLKALAASRPAYDEAEGYYKGTIAEFFTNSAIGQKLAADSKTFRMPFASIPVDARVGLLDIASVVTGEDSTTEILRTQVWEKNELDQDIEDVFREAGYLGDSYMTVWEGDEEGEVEVFANSPLTTRLVYSRENSRRALFAIRIWESDEPVKDGGKPRFRANLLYKDRIEQYISTEGKSAQTADDFEPYFEDDDEPDESGLSVIDNPYDIIPVFHFRQGSKPYGTPLHKKAYGPQDAIVKINSTHLGSIDFLGYPQRYALVDGESDDDADDSEFFDFTEAGPVGPGDVPEVRKRKSKLKSGPGETWWLEGVKSVGQFEAAGADNFIEPIKFQIRAMARLTNTPANEFDIETGDVPSGVSYVRAYAPLHRDVRQMQRSHGRTLEAMLELALLILGHANEEVTVKWSPVQVAVSKEDWEIIEAKTKNGIPLKTALIDAGFDDQEIEAWFPDDGPALSLNMIKLIGDSMSGLGQGIALGALTLEDIAAMIPSLYTTDRPEVTVAPPIDETLVPIEGDQASTAVSDAQVGVARAEELKAKADALGAFVRAGADQDSAAALLGLKGLTFSSIPTTVRLNDQAAGDFESKDGATVPKTTVVADPAAE